MSDWFFSQWECHWCRKFTTRCPLRWSRVAIKGCDVELTEGEELQLYKNEMCQRIKESTIAVIAIGTIFCVESERDYDKFLKQGKFELRIMNWELICERNKNARRGNRTHVLDVTGSENLKGRVAHNRAPNHAPCLVAHILDSGQASSGRYFCSNTLFRPFPESVHPSE